MANFNYSSDIQDNIKRLTSKEQMLGKGLNIPFNATNSGSRKVMDIVHQDHALVLSRGEVPYVGTGYENMFGDRSSSILKLDNTYQVVAKIPKFSDAPNHHYYLILADVYTNTLHMVERVSYKYSTEAYGYLQNNTVLDSLSDSRSIITPNHILRTSTGFDQFGNKTNGINLNVVYMASDDNMEDSTIISESCSRKCAAPLIRKVKKIINENDIPLNIYGDNNNYKIFPEIGQNIERGILLAFRREDKENAIYAQSVNRLQQVMMSDEKITLKGTVIDINIYCNNPANLSNNLCNSQFNKYYLDRLRFCTDVVRVISSYVAQNYLLTYELQKLFSRCKDELSGKEFNDKRKFSNIEIEFIVMEERNLDFGDKVADRFGGKGVVSKILPDELMPRLPNGQIADMIKNNSTMNNRENAGQIFEVSENYVSMNILDHIRNNNIPADEALELILKFLNIVSPDEEEKMRSYAYDLKQDDFVYFVSTLLEYDCIHISNEPISDRMDIDLIGKLYEEFNWITPVNLIIPIKDSSGDYRYIPTRRPMIMAKQYIYRLKQLAEEKFSATSLSSTNIKNENAKSKASKNYKELYPNTPIKFGPMESGDMEHMGADIVIINLMLYSTSPIGRRLIEEAYTGDPYNVDIKLNSKAKNRSVEQLNTKLKTMGYRFVFNKKKRIYKPVVGMEVVEFLDNPSEGVDVVEFVKDGYDIEAWNKHLQELEDIRKKSVVNISLLSFGGSGSPKTD